MGLRAASPLAALGSAPDGLTRRWVKMLTGPGNLALIRGRNVGLGRVIDAPETPRLSWTVYVGRTE